MSQSDLPTTRLVDSHCHLDSDKFDADRDAVIARAREAGLEYVLLIADLTRPESVRTVADLAEHHEGFYWAAGVDPHQSASAREEHFAALRQLAGHPKFLAVGEIGLDYYYDYPRDAQERIFRRQTELGRELGKPVIIHCRDAWADLQRILRDSAGAASSEGGAGILHCFSGTAEDAHDLIGLGFYVSFAGNLTFKKAEVLREVARSIPADRLLSETDSPYLAPVPYRGRRNEPAWVREVTRALAELHGLPEAEMGRRLVANFECLFGLDMHRQNQVAR